MRDAHYVDPAAAEAWVGLEVFDSHGERIGKLSEVYVGEGGTPDLAVVRTGLFGLRGSLIGLGDGEHHPSAVRESLERLDAARGVAGVIFCGGEEKVRREVLDEPLAHYGFGLHRGEHALETLARETGAIAVVDLADEP